MCILSRISSIKIMIFQHFHYSAKNVQIFVIIPQLLLPSNLYKEWILWCCYTDLIKSYAASQKKLFFYFILQLEHLFTGYLWNLSYTLICLYLFNWLKNINFLYSFYGGVDFKTYKHNLQISNVMLRWKQLLLNLFLPFQVCYKRDIPLLIFVSKFSYIQIFFLNFIYARH